MKRRSLVTWLLTRIGWYILTLWSAVTVAFITFRLVPGNPIGAYVTQLMQQGKYEINPVEAEKLINEYKKTFGLEGDLLTQYICYFKEVIFHHNLGVSFISFPTPVQVLIIRALPWTIALLSETTVFSWLLGNIIGIIVGWKRGTKVDSVVTSLALVFSQIPYYIVAVVLILLFVYITGTLPPRGAYSSTLYPEFSLTFFLDVAYHAVLPSLSLILVGLCGWLISMRSLAVSILGEDYLLFAQAKGLKEHRILSRYLFRNALLPQITGLAIALGSIVNGAYLVEYVFNYPGMGYLFVTALGRLDYNTIQGCVMLTIFTVLTAILLIDITYPLLDPRIRYGGE
ncbi:MAG: ABC transporter permease [Thaumarchaeota archaeon]|nr:ABC transporter permease [Nitrososphaerota archaeon]